MLRFHVILKETLTSYNCRADCAENQAQDVIFTCGIFAKEIKCAPQAEPCVKIRAWMGKSEMMIPGDHFTFKPGNLGPPLSEENCSLSPPPISLPRDYGLTSAETGAWRMAFILLGTWSPLPFMASRPTTRAMKYLSVSRYTQALFCEVIGYTPKELRLCIMWRNESWEWQTTGQSGRREKGQWLTWGHSPRTQDSMNWKYTWSQS